MPLSDRNSLLGYNKKLEETLKQYHLLLKQKDAEIAELRKQLAEYTNPIPKTDIPPEPVPAVASNDPTTAMEKKAAIPPKTAESSIRQSGPISENLTLTDPREEKPKPQEKTDLPVYTPAEEKPICEPIPKSLLMDLSQVKSSEKFTPGPFFSAVMEGEDETEAVQANLEKLSQAKPEDRRSILLSLTEQYWRLVAIMSRRLAQGDLSWEKRLFIRFGMLDESLMPSRLDLWNRLYLEKSAPEDSGVYYLDEWLQEIALGNLPPSKIEETTGEERKINIPNSREAALIYEVRSIQQMQKRCLEVQDHSTTILVHDYCNPGRENPIITRSDMLSMLEFVCERDYQLFQRKFNGEENTIPPLFIIFPGYGQRGGCWEVWNPALKKKSGPRTFVCAFPPKSSLRALTMGLADYRWEYAKANAMHHWMTEGLTGKWMGLFSLKEQKKDLKELFLESYYHWIVNESRMIPKVEKRIREFLWTHIPFSDEIKQTLIGGVLFSRMLELEIAKKKREGD